MRALELHHGPLAGGVLGADDDESPSALVDAVHDLEGDELSHCPVSLMDAAPGLIHCGYHSHKHTLERLIRCYQMLQTLNEPKLYLYVGGLPLSSPCRRC